jgi:hypothetical protein
MLKQLLVIMPWGEHRLFSGFIDSYMGKFRLEIVSVQVFPPQVAQTKTWGKFCKIINRKQCSAILEIAGRLGLSYGTCQQILVQDLNMWQIPTDVCGSVAHQ